MNDVVRFALTGGLSTVLAIGSSILLIDVFGWSAKLYNAVFFVPLFLFRYWVLKKTGFNRGVRGVDNEN